VDGWVPRAVLTLPATLTDQYKIEWWTVDTHGDCAEILEHWAIYHVNTKWMDLYPSDGRPSGVDFENHWQIFREGRFSRRDAVAHALKLNLHGIEFVERKIEAHRVAIAAQRAELGAGS
jgi:hypothetical protein